MKVTKTALAGSLESNDCLVTLHPAEHGGIQVAVESIVLAQFGEQIEAAARKTLEDLGVESAGVRIQDKGALECTLRARLETAVARSREVSNG